MISIRQRLFKGAVWNAIAQFGSQGINFVVLIILARLLDPTDFGLVGMVTVFTIFLGYFSECGLTPSLVQKKEADETDYNTVFWSTVVFAAAIYAFVFLCAPLIAAFYKNNSLTPLIRALFMSFLFSPFGFVPETMERKGLHYRRIALADLMSLTVSGSLAVSLALLGFGVWSLVWLEVVRVFSRSLCLMVLVRWRPKLIFSFGRLKALMRSGAHFTMANMISYFESNTDFLIVGKFLGAEALGIYSFAFRISRYPFMKIWGIFGQMLFPAFVNFREDVDRIKRNFVKVSAFGGVVLMPLALFLFFGMESLTRLLFGMKWFAIVPLVRTLVVYLLFDSVTMADYSLMMVYNRIRIVNIIRIVGSVFLFGLGYAASIRFGVIGMAAVYTGIALVDSVIVRCFVLRELKVGWGWSLMRLKPIGALALVLIGFGSVFFVAFHDRLPDLLFLAVMALALGLAAAIFLIKQRVVDLKNQTFRLDALADVA